MLEVKRKRKPGGRPYPKGVSGNPNGRPTKAREAAKTFSECFIKLMNKEVAAQVGSEMVVRPNYEHFIGEMIKAGIKGGTGTPARKPLFGHVGDEIVEQAALAEQANGRGV